MRNTTTRISTRRQALTLVEMLVVIAIVGIVISAIAISSRAVLRSQDRSVAEQQIALIGNAIERYSNEWPAWEVRNGSGVLVKIADQGWPDYLPGRLFAPNANSFQAQNFFNVFNDLEFFPAVPGGAPGNLSGIVETPGEADQVRLGDVLNANICLTYSLTAQVGKGPYLEIDDQGALIKSASEVADLAGFDVIPQRIGTNAAFHGGESGSRRKLVLVDPWGTPYRYFWVTRDRNSYSGFAAIRNGTPGNPDFRVAHGYVLESAGPDRRFGNVWEPFNLLETDQRVREAADNITLRRP